MAERVEGISSSSSTSDRQSSEESDQQATVSGQIQFKSRGHARTAVENCRDRRIRNGQISDHSPLRQQYIFVLLRQHG